MAAVLFVSCTNFRAVEARPLLQQRLGVPVVTSNQATIEATFAAIGATTNWPVSALASVTSTACRRACLPLPTRLADEVIE
jgi:maleate cis-trans isomerase